MKFVHILGCACALACGITQAQTYPSGAMRLIVPFPPGGGTDILARPIAQKLTERWGQSVVVDSRPGGSAMIGRVDGQHQAFVAAPRGADAV